MSSVYAQLFVHLVWATSERRPLISEEVEPRLLSCMRAKCEELGCRCIAAGAADDHVHVLVSYPTSVAVATLAGQLKGASAHLANRVLGYDGAFAWQVGYGAFSVSRRSLDTAAAYVLGQRRHHAECTTYADLERCGD